MQKVERDWASLLKLIPGYDSYHDAKGFTFDPALANRVCTFIETQLVMIEGRSAGSLFSLLPWQAAFLGCLFGWVDASGARRYREAMLYIPRKCGKSPLAAAILDYVLLCDGEEGAQCYCAAADRDQAGIVYRHAKGMLERGDGGKYVTIYNSTRQIMFGQSFAKVISAEAASKHGYNSHLVIVDELHAQPDRELVDVLTTSTSTRRQPIILYLTTADYERPSICNERHDYACKVRDGIIKDPRFLPVVYEATKDDDWESPAVWAKANPSLGVTKTLEYMERECEKAKNEPTYQATFRRLELNQKTDAISVWLPMDKWDACPPLPSEDILAKQTCWAGLDLSATTDLTALGIAWPCADGIVAVRVWHWIPEARARKKEKEDRVPYLTWASQGFIELTPGDVVDYQYIRKRINDIAKAHKLKDVGTDPWNATQITTELVEQDGIKVIEFRQGFVSMSSPCKEIERLVMSGKLAHGGNPVLRWQVGHAVVRNDPAGNIKLDKEKATQRIDGLVSIAMAIGRMSVGAASDKPSPYETRGIRFI